MVVLVAALVAVLTFDVQSVYSITGFDPSARNSETYVDYGGTRYALRTGEELNVRDIGALCTVTYRSETGWQKTHKKSHVRITIRKFNATVNQRPKMAMAMLGICRSRKVMLNYPPASSVWHLPIGISQLTACLRQRGHDVIQRYGHIIGLEYVLQQTDGKEIESALRVIRNTTSDILALYAARKTFERVSSAVLTADKFRVERNNVSYVSADYDGTIEGIIRAIQTRENNMWYQYFAEVELPLATNFRPHVYGISIADERQLVQGCILASMVKDALPETLVVMGGNLWSRVGEAFTKPKFAELFKHFDAVSFKEGHQPIEKLADSLDLASTPGIVWKNRDRVVINSSPSSPTIFETLPTPAYDGGADQWSPDRVIPLYTSSNCPMACGFCAIAAGSDTFLSRPRVMSPERIAEHMMAIGAKRFDIADETFTIPRQLALGSELKKQRYEATWQCYLTVTNSLLDPSVAEKLYASGCRAVQLGLESLSPETLTRECKGWNSPGNYGAILRNFRRAGIQTHVFVIVGLPGEPLNVSLRWLPFFEEYGDSVLTIKSGRYRLTRMSPESMNGTHSELIEVLSDSKPLHLNANFRYRNVSRKKVEAIRDIMEEACRRHWAYKVTSTIPWWINRGRYTWKQLEKMSRQLPADEPTPHFSRALVKAGTIVREELGRNVQFVSYEEVLSFAKQI